MNLAGDDPQAAIDPAVWEGPSMRAALRNRDVGEIYRLLKRHGVSQRRIGALTGQTQPEVSEISKGRQVMAYDLLARIADGLGMASDELGRDTGRDTPTWLSFMDSTEVEAASGMTYNSLADHNRGYAEKAIEHRTRSYEMRPSTDARTRTTDLILISANSFRAGNVDEGIRNANAALTNLETVRSTRLVDRLASIQQGAALYPRQTHDLAEHLTAARAG